MNAKELRLGNAVYFNNEIDTICEIGQANNGFCEKGGYFNFDKGAVKPIPLTEEWILKFGFEKDEKNEYWFWKKCVSVSVLGYIELLSFNRQSFKTNIQLKYIHQLQNLYFALIGEELVVSDAVS